MARNTEAREKNVVRSALTKRERSASTEQDPSDVPALGL